MLSDGVVSMPTLEQLVEATTTSRKVLCNACNCEDAVAFLEFFNDRDDDSIWILHEGNGNSLACRESNGHWEWTPDDDRISTHAAIMSMRRGLIILPKKATLAAWIKSRA